MNNNMKRSLAWKWVVASLLIESFMLSVMVFKNVAQLQENLSTQTYIRLNEQKVLLQSALSAPLAQMDYATIEAILKETKEIPNIDYLVVEDSQKNFIASVGRDQQTPLPKIELNPFDEASLADKRYDTSIPITLYSQKLGEVYLGLSTDFYIQARDEMITRSIAIAIVELVLSAILLIAISQWITKNLVRLTYVANTIADGNYSKRLNLGDTKEAIELENAFNKMISNIQHNIQDLQNSYDEQKNLSLQLRDQLETNHKQHLLLEQQSRMAALGEMLANIAHQWRQPLNAITINISSLKLKNDLGVMDENDITNTSESVIKYATYLSHTIDDFRNFIKNDRVKEPFSVQYSFEKAKDIVFATLSDYHITLDVIASDNDYKVDGMLNELTQVFINLLNNAKDILIEKRTIHRIIQVKFYQDQQNVYVTIHDNGGGIKEAVINKVFDPYFTTKHKSQGTGLGLYMSAKTIHEHFMGEIFIHNELLHHDNGEDMGARFYILLPLHTTNQNPS